MERVLELIREHDLRDALVRLWVLASRHNGDDRVLNAWERNKDEIRYQLLATQFRKLLRQGKPIGPIHAEQEPLALITALDGFLAEEQRISRKVGEIPYQVDGREYWLVRHPLARRSSASMALQANNSSAWFGSHSVIPRLLGDPEAPISIQIAEPDSVTAQALEKILVQDSLRIFVAHFIDGVRLDMQTNAAGKCFALGLSAPDVRSSSILATLDRALTVGAHVVVFPELTVTQEHRKLIARWRIGTRGSTNAPILILSGSFHEEVAGRRVNRAELTGLSGRLMTHEKIRPFGAADGIAEDIASGGTLTLLSTPIGLVAIPICKDFNDVAGAPDWTRIQPDWCLVPSMGDERNVRAHVRQAEKLWQVVCRAVSAVANQEFDGQPAQSGFGRTETLVEIAAGGYYFDAPLNSKAEPVST